MKVHFNLNLSEDLLIFCKEQAKKNYSTPTQVMVDAIVKFKNEVEKKHGT